MKLIMDNGNEYELREIQHPQFIVHSVQPNQDFINSPYRERQLEGELQPFLYKSIQINSKFYAPKFIKP